MLGNIITKTFDTLKGIFFLGSHKQPSVLHIRPYLKRIRRGQLSSSDYDNIRKIHSLSPADAETVANLTQAMSDFVKDSPEVTKLSGEYYFISKTILFRTTEQIKQFTEFFKAAKTLPYLKQLIADTDNRYCPLIVDCVLSGKTPDECNNLLKNIYEKESPNKPNPELIEALFST